MIENAERRRAQDECFSDLAHNRGWSIEQRAARVAQMFVGLPEYVAGNIILVFERASALADHLRTYPLRTPGQPMAYGFGQATRAELIEQVKRDRVTNTLPTFTQPGEVIVYWFDSDRQVGTFAVVSMSRGAA